VRKQRATTSLICGAALKAHKETLLDEIKKDLQSLDPRESEQAADPQTEQPASTNAMAGRRRRSLDGRNAHPWQA